MVIPPTRVGGEEVESRKRNWELTGRVWRQEERERGERGTVRDNETERRTEGLSVVIYTTPLWLRVLSAVPLPVKNRHRMAWSQQHHCTTTRLMVQERDMSYWTCAAGIIIVMWGHCLFYQSLTVKKKSVHSLLKLRMHIPGHRSA